MRTRPPVKQDAIVAVLRKMILRGTLASGDRLPSHTELERQFGTTPVTVQRALNRLIEDGFATSVRRKGTFVAEHPPHTRRIALAFPVPPDEIVRSRFMAVLASEARLLDAKGPISIEQYAGIDNALSHSRDFQRLVEDVQAHRLAGVIFAHIPFAVGGSPILREKGIPRVAVMEKQYEGVTAIRLASDDEFLRRAFAHLRTKKRRRVACICHALSKWRAMPEKAAKCDLVCRPHWVHMGFTQDPGGLVNVARALARLPENDRPDCLVISDDNFVEAVFDGLYAEGVRVPRDMEVVVHCNFPWPDDGHRAARLGYDIRALLSSAVEMIMGERRGKRMPGTLRVPARFEWELEPR